MAAAIISGITGTVSIAGTTTGASSIAEWSINPGKQLVEGRASNTAGGPVVLVGNEDWSGSLRCYGKTPVAYPGDSITFVGYTGAGSYEGTAVVLDAELTADIATGAPLSWNLTFAGNGALTRGGSVVPADATLPAMFTSAVCAVQRSDTSGGSYAAIAGVQRFTLKLARAPQTYAASQVIKRVLGRFDASANIDLFEADPSVEIQAGDLGVYRFFVDGTLYFQVAFMAVDQPQQNVAIEDGSIVAYRMPLKFSTHKSITGTMTRGAIAKPSAAGNWWA